jgi:hypothetical protein
LPTAASAELQKALQFVQGTGDFNFCCFEKRPGNQQAEHVSGGPFDMFVM